MHVGTVCMYVYTRVQIIVVWMDKMFSNEWMNEWMNE